MCSNKVSSLEEASGEPAATSATSHFIGGSLVLDEDGGSDSPDRISMKALDLAQAENVPFGLMSPDLELVSALSEGKGMYSTSRNCVES
jgi:hypothetical protein